MIRFLIHTVSSLTDINGNRYHFATITSTKTGNTLHIKQVGGESNARALLRKHTDADWEEINSTQSDLKIREFDRARACHQHDVGAKYEHEFTASDFIRLEVQS